MYYVLMHRAIKGWWSQDLLLLQQLYKFWGFITVTNVMLGGSLLMWQGHDTSVTG